MNGVAYRAVWRWHFYAGLLVAPVLALLAVTGALYLFNHEFERAWYGPLLNVTPAGAHASPVAQEAAVRAAFPGATLRSVEWPHDATHATTWSLTTASGERLDAMVDPYTARVLGSVPPATRPMALVNELHGELMLGRWGDMLVELAASWALVMLVTGVVLWWPRRWRWRGVVVPRLGASGRRFWRDLHAVPAVFNAALVGFLVLSGLPWSAFWGEQLARLGTLSTAAAPTPNFQAAPRRSALPGAADTGHHHDEGDSGLPWAVRQAPVPPPARAPAGAQAAVGLGQVMATAAARGLDTAGPRLRVFYPDGADGVFHVSLSPARAQDQRTLYIDPTDGRVLQDIGWAQYSALGRAVEWGVTAHMGRQFGEPNRWLALAVCAGLLLTVVSGVVMWWRRRPAGGLGAPDAAGQRLPRALVVTLVTLGVLFPLAGATMLAAAALEWANARLTRAPEGVA